MGNIEKILEELNKYNVYNPKEIEYESKLGHTVHCGPYSRKDLRNMFIGTLKYGETVQSVIDGIREAIDKMPDEWVAEFLKVQNGDVVELVNESVIESEDRNLVNEVDKLLNDNNLYYNVFDAEDNTVAIEVEGDWKHDHAYLNNFMQEHGFVFNGEDSVENNGTDFYTSTHYFKKNLNESSILERKYADGKSAAANDDSLDDFKPNGFKIGDLVVYLSTSGPTYHCFAEYIGPMEDNKVSIRLLCKIDGRIDVSDICDNEEGIITVSADRITKGKERLQKKIQILKNNLSNLENIQKGI